MPRKPKKPDLSRIHPQLHELVVPIEQLHPDTRNARTHDEVNLRAIAESIERSGFRSILVVQREGMIVRAGNARLEVARRLGLTHVPAIVCDDEDLDATVFALADNRTAELAAWDPVNLGAAVAELERAGKGVAWLFDRKDLDGILATAPAPAAPSSPAEPAEPDEDEDAGAPPPRPRTRRGDVVELGVHRLLCVDAFSQQASDLVGRAKHDAVVTDPPYAIYGSSTGVGSDVADDKMVRPFFDHCARLCEHALKVHGHAYLFTDWRSWAALADALRSSRIALRNMLVWAKNGGLGSNYANMHELVAFAHHLPPQIAMRKRASGVRSVLKSNVITGHCKVRGDEKHGHNASKPVDLFRYLVENSTDEGQRVLDPFAGSGSVLIACEKAGRVCTSIEIEPKWCDVIARRWAKLTGKDPVWNRGAAPAKRARRATA